MVDEVLVVVGSDAQREAYKGVLDGDVELLVDLYEGGSPLVGAMTGLSRARGRYAFITGCDSPFLSPEAIQLLFSESEGLDGATFQWPNGWIEPLMAIYRVEPSLNLALEAYRVGDLRLRRVLRELPKLKLIPIDLLRSIDPRLLTLFDIDTEDALSQAEEILKELKNRQGNGKSQVKVSIDGAGDVARWHLPSHP